MRDVRHGHEYMPVPPRVGNHRVIGVSGSTATGSELPNRWKSLNDQTTFLSGVTSSNCGFSGPAWQLTTNVLPLSNRPTIVIQASFTPGRSFSDSFQTSLP